MVKKVLFFIFFLFASIAFAQSSKISLSLLNKMDAASRMADYDISVFVKGNVDEIKSKTEQIGGIYKYSAGNTIAAIRIPISKVTQIASLNSVTRIEDNSNHIRPLNDVAIVSNHVDLVHQGFTLPQGYDGQGVVVAVIDEDLDPHHPDFHNADGSTRFKYVWDQTGFTSDTSLRPQPFNYGVQYRGNQIDTITTLGYNDLYSHGTHVTGSACGNGMALNNYTGMAPKADIVFVKLAGLDENSYSSLVDAVVYAFACGDSLHEPVSVNLSVGDYFGSHDGRDIQAQAIDALLNLENGRVVVAAAGNDGAAPIHLQYNIVSDTTYTWLQYQSGGSIDFQLWSDTGNFENAQFAVGIDRVFPNYQYLGGNNFNNISPYLNQLIKDTIYTGGNRLGIISTSAQIVNGAYELDVSIKPDSVTAGNANYYWRFMTKGTGKFDAWSTDMVHDGLPLTSVFPFISKYKKPDTDQSIVSSFQCSDQVITVGSYDNRNSYTNAIFQQTVDTTYHPGALSAFSSHGPTRDGRNKPDITAPGAWVLSCGGQYNLDLLYATDPAREAAGRKHFRSIGTSMASPMVAGICALYLQRYPNASWQEIKNALITCSTQDNFTGNSLPDNFWGYGKANAYTMIKGCVIGIDELNGYGASLSNYPNPFSDNTTIDYDLSAINYKKAELKICDVLGNEVKRIPLNEKRNSLSVPRNNLTSGIYFYSLLIDGKKVKTNKLVVL